MSLSSSDDEAFGRYLLELGTEMIQTEYSRAWKRAARTAYAQLAFGALTCVTLAWAILLTAWLLLACWAGLALFVVHARMKLQPAISAFMRVAVAKAINDYAREHEL